MELWMQIALGITIGGSIILLSKSLKNKIDNYNPCGGIYHIKNPENFIKEMKNDMKRYCLFSAFALVLMVILMNVLNNMSW